MSTTWAPIPGVTVIGIGHRARHGKDSMAAAMVAADPSRVKRFAFADDLYALARVQYGMTTKDAPLLQRLGVEMRETKGEDVWVNSVYQKILEAKPAIAVIPDVRFPNEMVFVRALGGVCVRVTRYNRDGSIFIDPSRPADHVSEIALADAEWDIEIVNDKGPEDLNRQAYTLLEFVKNCHRSVSPKVTCFVPGFENAPLCRECEFSGECHSRDYSEEDDD